MFPVFHAEIAEELALKLNQTKVGTHTFEAWVSYDGKKKHWKQSPKVKPWDCTLSGTALPPLSEQVINQCLSPLTDTDYFAKLEADLKGHAICKKDKGTEGDSMTQYLFDHEIEKVKETKTYRFAVHFRPPLSKDSANALFQMGGFI